jgi:glycosidase
MKNLFSRSVALLLFFSLQTVFAQIIERMEPPNWWTDMEHNSVEVLLYGENIGSLAPQLNSKQVRLEQTIRVENPNYLFLKLIILPEAKAEDLRIHFYDKKKKITSVVFPIYERDRSISRKGFDSSDVMYLITPDRFANGDPSNDEFADMKEDKINRSDDGGRHGGDLLGIENRLDYIFDLGFTALWLNPILENDMYINSYHGYAATDFYRVDARYGTNEQYRLLCAKAQQKGIKVIMDMILNHCGSEHWFVKDPPNKDWINNKNTYVQTSHRRTTHQDPYASEYDKKAFVDGWFVETMPDLNQKDAQMANYLIQNTLWWIEYSGVTGIRMDTYPYPDKDFMSDWTNAVMKEYPDFTIVGEEWSLNPAVVSFWQRGKTNKNGYLSSLTSVMDFPIQDAFKQALIEKENWNTGWIKVYEMLGNDHLYADPFNLVIFPDNHDMDRFYTQVNNDADLLKMGLVYFATMRGIPQFYYGTEIGMKNDLPGHGQIRSDFPGGWTGDAVDGFSGRGLSSIEKDIKEFTRKLLNWRKSKPVIHRGNLIQFAPENGVYTFFRYNDEETIMVLFNKNDEMVEHKLSKYEEMLGDFTHAANIMGETTVRLDGKLNLSGKKAYIFSLSKDDKK